MKTKSLRHSPKKPLKLKLHLEKGSLFGYHVDNTLEKKHKLFKKLLSKKEITYSELIKRLNILAIYNKRKHPDISKKVRKDIKYIQEHFKMKYSLSSIKKSIKKTPKRRISKKRKSLSKKRTSKVVRKNVRSIRKR